VQFGLGAIEIRARSLCFGARDHAGLHELLHFDHLPLTPHRQTLRDKKHLVSLFDSQILTK
jgi:hypothetical protein